MDKTEFIRAETRSRAWAAELTDEQIESFVRLFNEVWGELSEAEIVRRIDKALGGLPAAPDGEPNTPYKKPDNFSMVIANPIRSIFEGKILINDIPQPVKVGKNKKTKEYYTVDVQLFLDQIKEQGVKLPVPEELCLNTMNGIVSILSCQNSFMTPKQVCETFLGRPTDNQSLIAEVDKCMDFFTHLRTSLDWTQHALMKGLPADPTGYIVREEYFFNADRIEAYQYGQKVVGYQLNKLPPFYTYPAAVGQIANFDRALLEAPHTTSRTPIKSGERIAFVKNRMLMRINQMKTNRKANDTKETYKILFDPLYTLAGATSRTQQQRLRESVFVILEAWIDERFIDGYDTETKGKKIYAVKIKV